MLKKNELRFDYLNLESPIRDEIYSPERLEQFAHFLAQRLSISTEKKIARSLLPRVKENQCYLKASYKKLTELVEERIELSPAAEWIIDNFHIIEDQVREIREDLPEKYYLELPKIKEGELAGYPRVYAIALSLVAHSDSYIDIGVVKQFIHAYQKKKPLLIGEIWAIPIALRIALIENLRRLAIQTVVSHELKKEIDILSDKLISSEGVIDKNTEELIQELKKKLGRTLLCDYYSISQLSQRLHARNPEIVPICECVDEYLAGKELNIDEIVKREHQIQAETQLSISNAITSMRLLSNTDWQDFFESLALIETILRQDPSGAYKKMEFRSRDFYRHAIERINKKTGHGELEIAKEAIRMAQSAHHNREKDIRKHHVGYYLVRKGVRRLEKKLKYKATLKEIFKRYILDHSTFFYLNFLAFLTLLLVTVPAWYTYQQSSQIGWTLLVAFLVLIPASDSSLNILNLFTTYFVGPFILPKIDIKDGIPKGAKTFVIVPTIINSSESIPQLIEDLEIRFLANQDKNLYFALLSDFSDANSEILSTDSDILESLKLGIEELNQKYTTQVDNPIFYLFHRKRLWNEKENKWMGWERKRGKIHEFNHFLLEGKMGSFICSPSYCDFFQEIKYIITLDSDTKLPRDAAKKLIGTILHPLNKPQLEKGKNVVTKGYSILQPRISITPESSAKSLFATIYSGYTGIDPYTTAVSDTYQDLFGEGIYTGKGLYVLETFEASLRKRAPDNSILSHDLFEGVFARTALVSDIEFLDDYPSHYQSYAKRLHRWIRGDWQIIRWIFSRIPSSNNKKVKNPLSLISRWKIFDNLRRSLVAPTVFAWFILCWLALPGNPWWWTLLILFVLTLPIYVHTTSKLFKYPRNLTISGHLKGILQEIKTSLSQLSINIISLPYQSYLHLDAILRTLYRVYISRKKLLEWTSAAEVESKIKSTTSFTSHLYQYSPLFSVIIFVAIIFLKPHVLPLASLFLVLWLFSPFILNFISQGRTRDLPHLQASDTEMLRDIACRTWNFFETFVNEENNWLPPDNFQEDPEDLVAQRTSPTNMGLYLLSTCSAYDFGYITPKEMLNRLEQSLNSMLKLPRRFGHFYNWYDTFNLTALEPEYISTVDSGNLAGHLLAIKQTCLEIKKNGFDHDEYILGFQDIIKIIINEIKSIDASYHYTYQDFSNNLTALFNKCLAITQSMQPKNTQKNMQTLGELQRIVSSGILEIDHLEQQYGPIPFKHLSDWTKKLELKIRRVNDDLNHLNNKSVIYNFKKQCDKIATLCHNLVIEMDFSCLYDKKRKLFTIGYKVKDAKPDESFYDLLASEARLTSFLGIAKGDISEDHWFHLGRQMTSLFHKRVLVSWSASMFEYLMPLLVMKNYFGTLLYETYASVVQQQIAYAHSKNLPWGLSESAYNARDLQMNYQYGPFGVPGMGLKRGLSHDYVISPYSTALAALVLPQESITNFKLLISEGLLTKYGFYEAVDFTNERIPPKQSFAVIKNFMAHHQGMTLVALDNLLFKNIMVQRFHRDPMIKSTALLLQERIPQRTIITRPRPEEISQKKGGQIQTTPTLHHIKNINTENPEARILSNRNYTVMLTAAGSGFSRCDGKAVFRWSEDPVLEKEGQFIYIQDERSNTLWPVTFGPDGQRPEDYESIFSEHKVEFWCRKENISSHTEVIVSAEDNVELRRLVLTNLSSEERTLNITSYCEPVLSDAEADLAHPAFNKLFVQTEYIGKRSALLASRRKRMASEEEFYALHQIVCDKKRIGPLQFETDRAKFLGRHNRLSHADGLKAGASLSGSQGGVLDPVFSFKLKVKLAPFETVRIVFISGLVNSRNEALRLIDQYHDIHNFEREDAMAWTHSQIFLKHLNITKEDVNTFHKIASALIFSHRKIRPIGSIIASNKKSQAALWSYGISGDIPILMVSIKNSQDISLIRDILQFHEYLRVKNISFDFVITIDESSSYRMAIYDEIQHLVRMIGAQGLINKRGGIFLLRKDLVPFEDQLLLMSVARVFFEAQEGSLKRQVARFLESIPLPIEDKVENISTAKAFKDSNKPISCPPLKFFNGKGGFYSSGREYQIYLEKSQSTPSPWINVISNSKGFGFFVSETGSSCTWAHNSRENRLTPWSNDPICDPTGEAVYIYDHDSQHSWSPTPGPSGDDSPYLIRHGQGYTIFEHESFDLSQTLTMYASLDENMKFVRLKIRNLGNNNKKLSIFYYLEWVLGFHRSKTAHYIVTDVESPDNQIFYARNPFQIDFGSEVAFVCCNKSASSFTCDRASFIGRLGNLEYPIGVGSDELNGNHGAGYNPCLALKIDLDLSSGEEEEIVFLLGEAPYQDYVKKFLFEHSKQNMADQAFKNVCEFWDKTLESIQIKTSLPQFDLLINRWLPYQTLSCRIWARTAFYQSGGAYGFRDQLQDVTSLLHSRPEVARNQIIVTASHQFPEGDVLHWWHPPTDKGVRTRFSDDLLWLPYVTSFYVDVTNDESIWEEMISFVEGPELEEGQDDLYLQIINSEKKVSLYEHCLLAIDRSLKVGFGIHDLPLMGSGDWNDGMSRVGNQGKGESVWLAWFLGANLQTFIKVCEEKGDLKKCNIYKKYLQKIKLAVESTGWDGEWYRRAYFDDGTPLGSHESDECKIDSIAQSWSIISNLGDPEHRKLALDSARKYLINNQDKMVHLFTPPFDKTKHDPGYIKGYLPGVRENGGQYTHAAIWLAMAFAMEEQSDIALKILEMINPIEHTLTQEAIEVYITEPYSIPADVYSLATHKGKGGWSWYTGSSGWFYRAFIENILGLKRKGNKLSFQGTLPEKIPEYEMLYQFGTSQYEIKVKKSQEEKLYFDGELMESKLTFSLTDDGKKHSVIVKKN